MADDNSYLSGSGLIGLGQQFYNAATKEWMPEIISEAAGLPGEALTATDRLLGIKSPLEQGKYLDYWRKFYGSPYGQETVSPNQGGGISPQAGLGEPFHTRTPYIPTPTSDVGLRNGVGEDTTMANKLKRINQIKIEVIKAVAKHPEYAKFEGHELEYRLRKENLYDIANPEETRKVEEFKQKQSEKAREADMRLLSALYKQRVEAAQVASSEPEAIKYMKEAQKYQDKYNELLGIQPLPSPQGGGTPQGKDPLGLGF